jgi:Family of unknown function (DUF5367)
MKTPLVIVGLALWLVGTIVLRLQGEHLLRAGAGIRTVILFAVSFALFALVARRLCRRFALPRDQWLAGAVSLVMPTLVLDPFSAAFFSAVFPNIPTAAAGVFGGWMLACCGGALAGVLVRRPGR